MTQIPLKECIIKHSKFVYKYYIFTLLLIGAVIGVIIGLTLIKDSLMFIKDSLISTISFIISQIWSVYTFISVYITSIISIIPMWVYAAGGLIFGPLVLVLIYCVWIRFTDDIKIMGSCSGGMLTFIFVLLLLKSQTLEEVFIALVFAIICCVCFLYCAILLDEKHPVEDYY